jgi:hypothetical protein
MTVTGLKGGVAFWDFVERAATYADFPQLGRGPFGNAIRIVKETDEYDSDTN